MRTVKIEKLWKSSFKRMFVSFSDKPKVVCYYSSWSIYRSELGKFKIEFIDGTLCTHLVFAFAGLNIDQKIDSLDYANDINVNSK
jgi:GH18 family chitinase